MEKKNCNEKLKYILVKKAIVLMEFIGMDRMLGLFLGTMKKENVLSRGSSHDLKIRQIFPSGKCG